MIDKPQKFEQADQQLDEILSRVKYIGPQPPPSEDEVMDMVVDEIGRIAGEITDRQISIS